MVAALVVGGVMAWRFRHRDVIQSAPAPPSIGAPKDMLIPFSLLRLPVAAWHVSATDVGLPPTASTGYAFASDGDKGYFAASDCGGGCHGPAHKQLGPATGYVYGLDLRTGARLFGPITLPGFDTTGGDCYANGPSMAVCFGYDPTLKVLSWVVDLDRRAVIYSGPTDFDRTQPGRLGVSRLLHVVQGKGIYGTGPDAKHSWFVPGSGIPTGVDALDAQALVPPMTIAAQLGDGGQQDRVFSVIDGRDLTPAPPPGVKLGRVVLYDGGFAYPWTEGPTTGGILFYDTSGKLVKKDTSRPVTLVDNAVMPTAFDSDNKQWEIYTAAGDLAIRFKATDSTGDFLTIGSTVLQRDGADFRNIGNRKPWQQWDLTTGKPAGPDCKFDKEYFVGSDGRVILTDGGDDYHQVAIDLATCRTLWERPSGEAFVKIGRALLRYGPGDTVSALRAPD
ncbi:hypothetical protein MUNTM_22520 [Mycobacterium sp. MUNTM1]